MHEDPGNRIVTDLTIPCPAGEPIGETLRGSGCFCRIEGTVILSASDPSSLGRFCTSGFEGCPTWQGDRERISGDLPTMEDQLAQDSREVEVAAGENAIVRAATDARRRAGLESLLRAGLEKKR